jgi:hypothetical protein
MGNHGKPWETSIHQPLAGGFPPSGRQAPHVIRHIEVRGQGLGGVTVEGGSSWDPRGSTMTHLK